MVLNSTLKCITFDLYLFIRFNSEAMLQPDIEFLDTGFSFSPIAN